MKDTELNDATKKTTEQKCGHRFGKQFMLYVPGVGCSLFTHVESQPEPGENHRRVAENVTKPTAVEPPTPTEDLQR